MERLKGIGVSAGAAAGPALVAIQRTQVIRFPIHRERVARELVAIESARLRSHDQLVEIRDQVASRAGADLAAIFDAQLLMLEDPLLVRRAADLVRDECVNAEWAVQRAFDELTAVFNDVQDPYLRERKGDLQDVAGRLRMNMRGEKGGTRDLLRDIEAPCILVADELTPSVVAQLDWSRILGFATDAGSRTYHTAILARSLGVPAVVGLHDVTTRIPPGASVLIDGDTGDVTIDPSPTAVRSVARRPDGTRGASDDTAGPCRTRDGVRVYLHANIDRLEDVAAASGAGAEGIGLYRSEFLLAGGPPDMASEDEQFEVYRQIVERMAPRPVSIRTFDIDQSQLDRPLVDAALDARWFADRQRGGSAGLRGIRFGLAQPEIFKRQLRALIRAANHGTVRVLFPFVSSVEEARAARALFAEAGAEVAARGVPRGNVPIGVMIEVPSAALSAAALAREVDFFTVGTNDLIQYTLAVDRTDERVSDRYQPLNPAILRLIRLVRRGAARHRVPVSVCGEMASDPVLLQLLIGCGLREFSMTPGAMAMARRTIADASADDLTRIAARILRLGTVDDVERCLSELFGKAGWKDEVTVP